MQQLCRDLPVCEADAAGLADGVGRLTTGASRGAVLAALSESNEFKADIADQVEVTRLYFLLEQRMPAPEELQGWIEFLQGDSQADDAMLYQQAIDDWMNDLTLSDEMRETFLNGPGFAD